MNLSGKEIEGGGHFEMIADRFCVEAKSVVGLFLRGQRHIAECAVYSIFLIINMPYFRCTPPV